MHRSWLVVAVLTLVGCFGPGDDSKGPADSGTGGGDGTEDAGSVSSSCGNGRIDIREQCEARPLNLNGETCATATLGEAPEGELGCNTSCTLNISRCTGFGGSGIGGVGGVSGVGGVGGVGGGF